MSKFTRIPENTFKEIVINAGLLATNFNPKTAEVAESELMGATSGGTSFAATPSFIDYSEDIDNCPANTMELKRIDSIEAKLSGTFVTLNTALGKKLAAAADETEAGRHVAMKLGEEFRDLIRNEIAPKRELRLLGRRKAVINFSGMKIFPQEVEAVLDRFPGVAESLVYGEPHPEYGQLPQAKLVLRDGPLDVAALRAFCRAHLAPHKIPKAFETVAALPKTASGKIRRV